MPVPMELSRIIISEIGDNQVIYLKEINGPRQFPILIGLPEAAQIDRRVKGWTTPRPLTHDLIIGVVEKLGGEFHDVIISELKEHTYYAKLRVQAGRRVDRDRCPSLRCHCRGDDLQAAAPDLRERRGAERRPGRGVGQVSPFAPRKATLFCRADPIP